MKFDSYTVIARLFPGIIAGMPLFVLHFYFLRPLLGDFWGTLLALKIASDVTVPVVFLFSLMQLSRFVSKELFEKRIFNNGLNLPTSDFLSHLDKHFSHEYTEKVHKKIKADFGIEIPSFSEEDRDPIHARKLICEAVSHIRAKVGKGKLVGQHNAEYGFYRNMAGGTVIAVIAALINAIIFYFIRYDQPALWISLVLLGIYGLYLILAMRMIIGAGRDYAKVLVQEYMAT